MPFAANTRAERIARAKHWINVCEERIAMWSRDDISEIVIGYDDTFSKERLAHWQKALTEWQINLARLESDQ